MDAYNIIRTIGEGAMGRALLVEACDEPGKLFVVKRMELRNLSKKEKKHAMTEISLMKQLDHPFIVSYQDSFFEGVSAVFIVMEYAEGGDIQAMMDRRTAPEDLFDEDQILDWFTQLCLAVKHIHDMKIIHRDLKTENVFLSRDNCVKLGDFGLGRELVDSLDMARTTAGTPFYLSPEICTGMPYNQKSDVWALGCVLYKIITFTHAFQSDTLDELIKRILDGTISPLPKQYSKQLQEIIDLLFTPTPDDRPSTDHLLLTIPVLTERVPRMLSSSLIEREFGSSLENAVSRMRKLPVGARMRSVSGSGYTSGSETESSGSGSGSNSYGDDSKGGYGSSSG